MSKSPDPDPSLLGAIRDFIGAPTWSETRQVAESHPELLLASVDAAFELLVETARSQRDFSIVDSLSQHWLLLRRCREIGIDGAFASLNDEVGTEVELPPELEDLPELLDRFINADSWAESEAVLEENPSLMLPAADQLLEFLIGTAESSGDKESAHNFRAYAQVLSLCRRRGIREGFAERSVLVQVQLEAERNARATPLSLFLDFAGLDDFEAIPEFINGHPDLLTSAVDEVASRIVSLARSSGANHLRELAEFRWSILRRSREVGVSRALGELQARVVFGEDLSDDEASLRGLLIQFINTGPLPTLQEQIHNHPELLAPETDALIEEFAVWAESRSLPGMAKGARAHARLLRRSRDVGPDLAVIELNRSLTLEGLPEGEMALGLAFLTSADAGSAEASKAVLRSNPALLTPAVDVVVQHLLELESVRQSTELFDSLKDHWDLVRSCREVGLDEAFAAQHDASPAQVVSQHARRAIAISSGFAAKFERTHESEDLDAVISSMERAAELTKDVSDLHAPLVASLARLLMLRYSRSQQVADLDAAIRRLEHAVDDASLPRPVAGRLSALMGAALRRRYLATGKDSDLNTAIGRLENGLSGQLDPETRWLARSELAMALHRRFEREGTTPDLERSIHLSREDAGLAKPESYEKAVALGTLAVGLLSRYENAGDISDLGAAIETNKAAISILPDEQQRYVYYNNLGAALRTRYELTGRATDLDAAITYHSRAIEALSPGHPELSGDLSNLGNDYLRRYERTGHRRDIQAAIDTHRHAIARMSSSDPERSMRWASLANCLLISHDLPPLQGDFESLWESWRLPA